MRGRESKVAISAAVAIAVCAMAGATAGSAAAHRAVGATCTFVSAQHTLNIRVTELRVVAAIQRDGQELVLRVDDARVGCGPVAPTVSNVDTISVFARTELALDLRKGRLAPGFTNEGDGSSEIEIDARFSHTGGLRVRGSRRADGIVMGELNGVHAVNLNSREAHRDADVTVDGGYNVLSVLGRGGNDRISARGGRGFDAPLTTKTTISAGAGRDRVKGGSLRDLIGGGAGADRISPGAGTDRIKSLGGVDRLRLRDGERDYARCGPGEDKVKADRKDRLAGCDVR
jgi:hypothetical protein